MRGGAGRVAVSTRGEPARARGGAPGFAASRAVALLGAVGAVIRGESHVHANARGRERRFPGLEIRAKRRDPHRVYHRQRRVQSQHDVVRRVPRRRPGGGPIRRGFSGPAPRTRHQHLIHGLLRLAVRRRRAQRLHGEVGRERTRPADARTRFAREFPRQLFERRGDPRGGAIGERRVGDGTAGDGTTGGVGVAEGAPRRRRPRDGDGPRDALTPRAASHHHPSNLGRRRLRRRERAPIQTRENLRQRVVGKSLQRRRRRVRLRRDGSIRHRRGALEREGWASAGRSPRVRRAGRSPPRRVRRRVERV